MRWYGGGIHHFWGGGGCQRHPVWLHLSMFVCLGVCFCVYVSMALSTVVFVLISMSTSLSDTFMCRPKLNLSVIRTHTSIET